MFATAVALLLMGGPSGSPIKYDEVVIFFPTCGRLDVEGKDWLLPIHGWIHEPERDSITRNQLLRAFSDALGLREGDARSALFEHRARPFLADNERAKVISIRLGERDYVLEPSGPNGHFRGLVRLAGADAVALLRQQASHDRWLRFSAVTRSEDRREFPGRVQLVDPTGLSVVSDVDDTIKVTEVGEPAALLANTFLREFRAVPGMAAVYRRWADHGAVFHYVSDSPWQLAEPLGALLKTEGFPAGSFHLKHFRWKDATFLGLFASPQARKPRVLLTILDNYPKRRFILVGDAGQQDPEIYADLARQRPNQVCRILIRDAAGRADPGRFAKAFEGLPKKSWMVFSDPAELGPLPPP